MFKQFRSKRSPYELVYKKLSCEELIGMYLWLEEQIDNARNNSHRLEFQKEMNECKEAMNTVTFKRYIRKNNVKLDLDTINK